MIHSDSAHKPRLRFIAGMWHCYVVGWRVGFGYTPTAAYMEWLQLRADLINETEND